MLVAAPLFLVVGLAGGFAVGLGLGLGLGLLVPLVASLAGGGVGAESPRVVGAPVGFEAPLEDIDVVSVSAEGESPGLGLVRGGWDDIEDCELDAVAEDVIG